MLAAKNYQFWFCTGSQDLYGDECLAHVAEHSQKIVKAIENGATSFKEVKQATKVSKACGKCKEKAKKFLYANGQGFGVVMDNAFSIIGKIFVFLGIISILATLNLGLVIFFIILILVSAKYEAAKRQV